MTKQDSKPKEHKRDAGLGRSRVCEGFHLSGRLWIEKGGETFLAWGRIILLERIRKYRSINAAARSMGMGYSHAWALVDQMNRMSPKPLVQKAVGGKGGGGSELTAEGEAAIENFWRLVREFQKWLVAREPRLWKSRGKPERKPGKKKKGE